MTDGSLIFWKSSSKTNFTDRVYYAFFVGISAVLLFRTNRIEHAFILIGINAICCAEIAYLQRMSGRSFFWQLLHDWYPLLAFIICFEEVSRLSFLFRDGWQDHYLLAFEARLFSTPPTIWLGRHGSPLLTELLEIGYFSYFILLLIVGGRFYATGRMREFRQVVDATVFSYLLCYLFFLAFPTEGPAHTLAALHNFPIPSGGPFHWMVSFIQKNAGVHGNAFPSVHVAGAVVSLFFAWRYAPRLGIALTPLILLLCIGAVYDRYHYASDVVAGAVFGLVPAWVVLRGWVGTRWEEGQTAQRWLPGAVHSNSMSYIYGINPVSEALKARGRAFEWVGVAKERHDLRLQRIIEDCRKIGIPVRFVQRVELDRMANTAAHQGVVAVTSGKAYAGLDDVIEAKRGEHTLIVVLDGVEDPHNLGAILRTANAAGADGVIIPERRAAGVTGAVAKASAGASEHLPIAKVTNIARTVEELKERNIWVVGLDERGTQTYDSVDYKMDCAIVLGAEGKGVHDLVRKKCDFLVSIPMLGEVPSLNVSVAAGVVLYEIVRQRRRKVTVAESRGSSRRS